ncbi:MAG: hypothetical protein C0442_08315 [Chlorobiaceae bacterium]|nr:hypothetical protein [Chlorobiaceae bacterium]
MIIIELVYNLFALVALSVLSGFIDLRYERKTSLGKLLQGLLFGCIAIIGMLHPFVLSEGVIFDGRSIVISLGAFFFGPISGAIAALMSIIFRLQLGGGGAFTGVLVILVSFLIGYLFYYLRATGRIKPSIITLYFFGFMVSVFMLLAMLSLPVNVVFQTLKAISPTVMIFYPIITLLIGKILLDQEERRTSIERYREEESLFRTTLYSIGDAVITTDINGKIKNLNRVAEELTGWKESEVFDFPIQSVFRIINEDTREKVENPVEIVLRDGAIVGLANHTLLINKFGVEISIADSAAPIKDDKGNILGVVLVFRDQTEENKSKKTINESEERYRLIASVTSDYVYSTLIGEDGSTHFEWVAGSFEEITGYTFEEYNDTGGWNAHLHPDDLEFDMEEGKKLLQNQTVITEVRIIKKDGSIVWIRCYAYPDWDYEKNKLVRVHGAVQNITEQKLVSLKLEQSEKKLRSIFGALPDLFFILDKEGRYLDIAPSSENLLYKPKAELLGKKIDEIFEKEMADKFLNLIQQTISTRSQAQMDYQLKINGSLYWFQATTVPFEDDKVIYIASDISKRKTDEEAKIFSESNLQSLINNRNESIWSIDNNYKLIVCNDFFRNAYLEFYRIELKIGINLIEILSPNLKSFWKPKYDAALNGEKINFEFYETFNGQKFRFDIFLNPIISEGKITGVSALSVDITERKLIEESLKERERIYSTLISNLPGFVYRCAYDKNWTMFYISQRFSEITGYRIEDIIDNQKMTFNDLIDPEYHEVLWNHWQKILANREVFEYEYPITTVSGETKWVWERGIGVYSESGEVLYLEGFIQDVTESKLNEQYLIESEKRYRLIAENTSDVITVLDLNLDFVYVSPSSLNLQGYAPEDLKKIGFKNTLKHESLETVIEIINEEIELEKSALSDPFRSRVMEFEQFCKDGSIIFVEATVSFIRDENRNPINILLVGRDITKRKKLEEELRESEEKFKTLVENASLGIYRTTPEGKILLANSALIKMLGFKSFEELNEINLNETDLGPEYNREVFMLELHNKGSIIGIESSWKRKDGSIIFVRESARVVRSENNEPLFYEGTIEDITERKLAVESLRNSEEKMRMFVEGTSYFFFYIQDTDALVTYVSPSVEKITGYSVEQWLGQKHWFVSDSPVNSEARKRTYANLKNETSSEAILVEIVDPRGKKILLDLYETPIIRDGKVIGLQGIAQDITEQMRGRLIQKIQYNITAAVVTSKNIEQLFNIVKNELNELINTKNLFVAFYDENSELFKSNIESDEKDSTQVWVANKSICGYVLKKKETIILSKLEIEKLVDRNEIELIGTMSESWMGTPLVIGEKIIGVLVVQDYNTPNAYEKSCIEIFRIIADQLSIFIEHKRNEENSRKLTQAIEQSPVSIIITNLNAEIEYVNPRFCEITGYSREEAIGKNPRILQSGQNPKEIYDDLWKTITNGKDWIGEFSNKKKNGEIYWESVVISPVVDDDGNVKRYIAIKEDITEKKKMIQELILAKEKAEEMNLLKSHFFANMSHELRTPFVGIMGFAELLYESLTDSDLKMMAQRILSSSKRLTTTLNMILDMTKVEFKKTDLHINNSNINDIIDSVYYQFEATSTKRNIALNRNVNFKNLTIMTDQKLFSEILINLVNNAIKFTNKGSIDIIATREKRENGEFVLVKVKDTGIGIPIAKQDLIWEDFRQASEGTNRGYEGTGLGLSIVKRYSELLGGKVYLESSSSEGSIFVFELPISDKIDRENLKLNHTNNDLIKKNNMSFDFKDKKILYVEDDPIATDIVNRIVSKRCEIDLVSNSKDTLQKVKVKKYDLILMDINLGKDMDGIELTALIREMTEYKNIPIVAITAFAREEDVSEFLAKGMSHCITKPFKSKDLIELLENIFSEINKK